MILDAYEKRWVKQLIERIDRLRVEQNMTMYQLASKATLSKNTVKGIYRQDRFPNLQTLLRLCEAFGLSLAEFFSYESRGMEYSKQEVELMRLFKALGETEREIVVRLVEVLARAR